MKEKKESWLRAVIPTQFGNQEVAQDTTVEITQTD